MLLLAELMMVSKSQMVEPCADEDPFQLEGLEARAPPLPEEPPPVASSTAANEAEPRNGVDTDGQHIQVRVLLALMNSSWVIGVLRHYIYGYRSFYKNSMTSKYHRNHIVSLYIAQIPNKYPAPAFSPKDARA